MSRTKSKTALSLGEFSERFEMLEVRCGNCLRSGRLRTDKLVEKHGHEMTLPDLRTILAGDCEHKEARSYNDLCRVYYPQLRELMNKR